MNSSESDSPRSIPQERRRAWLCSGLFAILPAIITFGLNLPTELLERNRMRMGRDVMYSGSEATDIVLTRTGWPLAYRMQMRVNDLTNQGTNELYLLHQSNAAWLLDVFVGIIATGLVAGFTLTRFHRIAISKNSNLTRLRFDIAIAAGLFLVPAAAWMASSMIAARHMRTASRLSSQGAFELSAEVPVWLDGHLPGMFQEALLRIRRVELLRPTPEAIDEVLRIPSLRAMRLVLAKLEGSELESLPKARGVTEFVAYRCSLTSKHTSQIGNHHSLVQLSLRGTPLKNDQLADLDQLPILQTADLTYTGIQLASFKQEGWKNSVRRMRLSRPRLGNSDELTLRGWKYLVNLTTSTSDPRPNNGLFQLTIADCPELSGIVLDRSQLHSLTARNLPKFRKIQERIDESILQEDFITVPARTRWKDLDLENCSSLRSIECNAPDLKTLRLRDNDTLTHLALGTEINEGFALQLTKSFDLPLSTEWLEEISNVPSVNHLVLSGIQLDQKDIEQLSQCKHLRKLEISQSGLHGEMIGMLCRLRSLEFASFQNCPLEAEQFYQFIELPKLKYLEADLSKIGQLDLVENNRLAVIKTPALQNISRVSMKNLPRLSMRLDVKSRLKSLDITNAPRLERLAVESEWPANAKLNGLTKLQQFVAVGSEVDDRIMDSILECSELDQLTLVKADVSQKKLKLIRNLELLTLVQLPHCDVNDSVVQHWRTLRGLRHVSLDYTDVSEVTYRWLSKLESLRFLSLRGIKFRPQESALISRLVQLSSLAINDPKFSHDHLQDLLIEGNLEQLSIVGIPMSDGLLRSIVQSPQLKRLFIDPTDWTETQLKELSQSRIAVVRQSNSDTPSLQARR